jgi:hypothetical protein
MKNKIAIGIVLIGILAISIMPVSAVPVYLEGAIFDSSNTACTSIDEMQITNIDKSLVWNTTTSSPLIQRPGGSDYLLTLESDVNIVVGNTIQYYARCGTETNTSTRTYTGLTITHDIYLNASVPVEQPDLLITNVWDNPGKGGYLFANESNDITVNINNSGSANAGSFDVKLEIDNIYINTTNVASLLAGQNTNVTLTGYWPTTPGAKTVNITVDSGNTVTESDESNNLLSTERTVYNNGYKGKRWTGGEDIVTVETFDIEGNVIYSVGDSAYTSSGWSSISASWSPTDLPIPSNATVLSAKLYIYYNTDKTSFAFWGDNTKFNSVNYPGANATLYSDVKGFGTGTYLTATYGTLVYNVTSNFNTAGNTVILGDGITSHAIAIDGMILQVVYSDANEPQRMIWINEGYDLLSANLASYGTDTTETIAYAPFTGGHVIDIAKAASARLIAVGPGANSVGNLNNVIFNLNNHWGVLAPYEGATQIGIADIDVTSELGISNTAAIQDNGDQYGMRAATTILVVEEMPGMKIDLGSLYDTEVGRHIMVPITANGFEQFYGTVEMDFKYNTSKFDFVAIHSNSLSTVTAYQDYPSTGILDISALNTAGVKGDVVLATVELNVVDGQDTESTLNLEVKLLQDIYGADIYNYIEPATVKIGNPGSLTVTATSTPQSSAYSSLEAILNNNGRARHTGDDETLITAVVTDSGLGINSVTVDLSAIGGSATTLMSETSPGSLTYKVKTKATTGINDSHIFIVTAKDNGGNTATDETGDLTIYRRGDVVRNNVVNMGDALYIARYTVGLESPTGTDLDIFKFVGDLMPAIGGSTYKVDMGDALYIARYSVGLEPAP